MRLAVTASIPGLLWPGHRSRQQVLRTQAAALRRLLSVVGSQVPELRERIGTSGHACIGSRDELQTIEPVHRDALQEMDIQARLLPDSNPARLVHRGTGGSSGKPLTILRTPFEEHFINLFRRRAYRLLGLRYRDRVVTVRWVLPNESRKLLFGGIRRRLGVFPELVLDCNEPLDSLADRLERIQPDVLFAYPSVAARLTDMRAVRIKPRLIFSGGETLLPETRRQLEETYGALVRDIYAATECNLIAFECLETGLFHIDDDAVLVEILTRSGEVAREDEEGEVVITALHSYVMPFVRYRTGDVAVAGPSQCPCGLPFATLRELRGRVSDYLVATDGTPVHSTRMIATLLGAVGGIVRQFQFIQETRQSVRVRVATWEPLRERGEALTSAIQEVLGHSVRVKVEESGDQTFERLGKRRMCISRVASHYDDYDPITS